jgi:3-oxoacyl-[acyl-carrier protein] reductase
MLRTAVVGMNKTTAKEWGPFGVRSNCVAYGWINTRLTAAKEAGASIEINGKKVALGSESLCSPPCTRRIN